MSVSERGEKVKTGGETESVKKGNKLRKTKEQRRRISEESSL